MSTHRHRHLEVLASAAVLLTLACGPPAGEADESAGTAPPGMIWIPGGEFTQGTDEQEAYPAERPAHRVTVEGFWMDETEVTNRRFDEFVKATGYVTTAERPPDWEELKKQLPPDTPKPPPDQLVPGSLVFTPPDRPVSTHDPSAWWSWTPGASWRHPEGPGSDLEGRWDHPVVQVSWDDAVAYAKWAGRRLPTEAEWEIASRGGLEEKRYAWGEELRPEGRHMANVWQGPFPMKNLAEDGFAGTAPVRSFPPNGHGLYEIIGNVWEWCGDWYDTEYYARLTAGDVLRDPTGPDRSYNPMEPLAPQRVTKGGSYLCSDDYCVNYRPSARRGTAADTGMSHIGFRTVKAGRGSDS